MSFISDKDQDFLCKVIVVGDQGVGKSSLLLQYTQNEFKPEYNVTIGMEFGSKVVPIEQNGPPIHLQIWDTAGQESFKSIVRSFYNNSAAAFIVYSITKRESFDALDQWLQEIRENAHQDIVVVVVGNQVDRESERQVTYEEGVQYMKDHGCDIFYETSAKTAKNVSKVFEELARILFTKFLLNQPEKSSSSIMSESNYLSKSGGKQENDQVQQQKLNPNNQNNYNYNQMGQNSQLKNSNSRTSQEQQSKKSSCC